MMDVLLGTLRLAHALAAAVWIGGTLLWVLTPLESIEAQPVRRQPLREALRVGIGVFILTGAILAVQRLGSAALPPTYFALLVIKIALAIRMFALVRRIGGADNAGRRTYRPEREILVLGVIVYALAFALRAIYEETLRW
jgi:hypothetical protein